MRRLGSFAGTLLINLLLHLRWSIPAWLLLAAHKLWGWSIWWFWLALGAWIGGTVLWMVMFAWARRCARQPDPPKENKNPYSQKNSPS